MLTASLDRCTLRNRSANIFTTCPRLTWLCALPSTPIVTVLNSHPVRSSTQNLQSRSSSGSWLLLQRAAHLHAVLQVAEDGVDEPDHGRQPRPARQQACTSHHP